MSDEAKPVGCHDHDGHDACCDALAALADAAKAISRHHACCQECGDCGGEDCCAKSMASVLDAVDVHVAHLRQCCSPKCD